MNQKQLHTLINRLVLVQMYRVEAYCKVLETSCQPDLASFFHQSIETGEKLMEQLFAQVNPKHVGETDDTALPADFAFAWNLLPDALRGHDKEHILNQCLLAEDQTLRTYRKLVRGAGGVPAPLRRILSHQWMALCGAAAYLRRLRSTTAKMMAKPWHTSVFLRFLPLTGQPRALAAE